MFATEIFEISHLHCISHTFSADYQICFRLVYVVFCVFVWFIWGCFRVSMGLIVVFI